jgi:hypothetical protein
METVVTLRQAESDSGSIESSSTKGVSSIQRLGFHESLVREGWPDKERGKKHAGQNRRRGSGW